MKHTATILFSLGLVAVSCNPAPKQTSGVTFAPQQQETVVDKAPAAQEEDENDFIGKVKLSVMVPNELTVQQQTMLENKLIQMTTACGMGARGGSPAIVLAPSLSQISQEVTATIPAKTKVKYDLTLYAANILTGDIYASATQSIIGVGDSEQLAVMNVISSISPRDARWQKMLQQADTLITQYYMANADQIISQAEVLAATEEYDQAVTLLNSIPSVCADGYGKAMTALAPILTASMNSRGSYLLAQMKAAIGSSKDMGHYSPEAMTYYKLIPANSNCKAEADALYKDYISKLDPEAEKRWEAEQKELQRNHEYQMVKEELATKVAIEGQSALLDKYQKDAAYDRLPWLRKLVHLGDLDPFDGYKD